MSTLHSVEKELHHLLKEAESNPLDPNLLNEIGVGYLIIGRSEEAITYLSKAVEQSDEIRFQYNLANAYSENDNPQMAADLYLRVLEREPDHIPSLNNLADCFEQTGNLKRAAELFEYLTKINDSDSLSHLNLGNFLMRQNRHIEAVKCFQTAIDRDDQCTDAYYLISWVLMKAGVEDKALEYAESGLQTDPHHEELNRMISKLRND
ncbi:tetratricopeptide repeat protein [Rhodohalobacter mucosus]|uniref:Tetratricopeptide repeat protein n=1 Tax=Rhodohalobacter mucosus TaxID=2079485 RepID=A0A316TV05_9BACT|nr:tetratricopeptide repeat protein [Rhodohalobacter mucosus]PWN07581.1 hypothetical protein DDZ15_04810 [Rhodohalobacter mucosus]